MKCTCTKFYPSESFEGTFAINGQSYEDAEALMQQIDSFLRVLASRRVPMLVSNPDFYRPGLIKSPMPGLISERYKHVLKQMGMKESAVEDMISMYGKPFDNVYRRCFSSLNALGVHSKEKICGIGDSIEHDIAGANRNGISSVFIENGVHSSEFGTAEGGPSRGELSKLQDFFLQKTQKDTFLTPTHTIPCFLK